MSRMFEAIKNRYEDYRRDEERVVIIRPADQEIRCNWSSVMVLVFLYVSFISFIVYGAIHLKDCPAENMLPISMIVIGSLGILMKIITCPYDWREVFGEQDAIPRNKVVLCICALLVVILLGWVLAYCYWSFKMDPDTKADDHDKPNYCLLEVYRNAYWGAIAFLTIAGLAFLCACGCCFIAARET